MFCVDGWYVDKRKVDFAVERDAVFCRDPGSQRDGMSASAVYILDVKGKVCVAGPCEGEGERLLRSAGSLGERASVLAKRWKV